MVKSNLSSHRTLILNSTFQPLSIASAKRSVSLLLSRKINVIKNSTAEIRSENKTINIPKVAILTYYVKAPYSRRVALNRENIFIRDYFSCQYCGNKAESVDHIIPKSRNKQKRDPPGYLLYVRLKKEGFPDGFQVLCFNCNTAKGTSEHCPHEMKK